MPVVGQCCCGGTPLVCCGCASQPLQWTLTVVGVVNDECTECNILNGVFTLTYIGGCQWRSEEVASFCDDPEPQPKWTLLGCNSSFGDVWALISASPIPNGGDIAAYIRDRVTWNCLGQNVMDLDTPMIRCSMPPTATLVPA